MPLITFDVGGVGEMLEYAEHQDTIVTESSAEGLFRKLKGEAFTPGFPLIAAVHQNRVLPVYCFKYHHDRVLCWRALQEAQR